MLGVSKHVSERLQIVFMNSNELLHKSTHQSKLHSCVELYIDELNSVKQGAIACWVIRADSILNFGKAALLLRLCCEQSVCLF
mmetsp:Transcript_4021/g.8642  ORF Transcript_4021/g.8642 Transcript_4021/m.8642 type:complete len:83 (-) Transcript_4021:106-354(-)